MQLKTEKLISLLGQQDHQGIKTLLESAGLPSNEDLEQQLAANGIEINATTDLKTGRTLLMFAVATGNLDIVALLLSYGANLSALDKDGDTALHIAVRNNNLAMVRLLASSANPRLLDRPLMLASRLNYLAIEKELLLNKGTPVIFSDSNFAENQAVLAALTRHPDIDCSKQLAFIYRSLLEHYRIAADAADWISNDHRFANPNTTQNQYLKLLAYLIKYGPKYTLPELTENLSHGHSLPFFILEVMKNNYTAIFKLLVRRADFDVNASILSEFKLPLLHCASSPEIVDLLLSRKDIKLSQEDGHGRTAFYYAVKYHHIHSDHIIHSLLSRGGNDTNIMMPATLGMLGTSVDTTSSEDALKYTPLQIFGFKRKFSLITKLLKAGAYPETTSENSMTILDVLDKVATDPFVFKLPKEFLPTLKELFIYGAGIYGNMNSIYGLDTKNLVMIEFTLKYQKVSRTTPGFEKAITTIQELELALKQGVDLKKDSLIALCRRRLINCSDPKMTATLQNILMLLTKWQAQNTLKNICCNRFNFNPTFFKLPNIIQPIEIVLLNDIRRMSTNINRNIITPDGLFQFYSSENNYKKVLDSNCLMQLGLQSYLQRAKTVRQVTAIQNELTPEELRAIETELQEKRTSLDGDKILPTELLANLVTPTILEATNPQSKDDHLVIPDLFNLRL